MEARVKATGEIVEVQRLCMSSEGDIWQSATGQEYLAWMLDFDFKEEPTPKYTPDYWTRLEHQYAGMAMQGLLMNEHIYFGQDMSNALDAFISTNAAIIAQALVDELKDKEERK